MRNIVFDTNILIDNIHGHARWLDELLAIPGEFHLIVPTIVISEFLTASEEETQEGKEKSRKYFSYFRIQDLNYEIAEILGTILRRRTHVPHASTSDLIIAATTIYLDGELATRNKKDFAKIPHLRFFDPKEL